MATHSAPVMNPEVKKSSRVRIVLEMIKFEHSVFALPFALVGALLGARATHRRLADVAATAVGRLWRWCRRVRRR